MCCLHHRLLPHLLPETIDFGFSHLVHLSIFLPLPPQGTHTVTISLFSQARPYWIEGSGVQMLEWTCYT